MKTTDISWAHYLDVVTFPLVFLSCCFGSVLIITIHVRKTNRENRGDWFLTHVIVCALAASNLAGILFEVPLFLRDHHCIFGIKSVFNPEPDEVQPGDYFIVVSRWGRECFVSLSAWLLICFSMERFISLRQAKGRIQMLHLDSVKGRTTSIFCALICVSAGLPIIYPIDGFAYMAWASAENVSSEFYDVSASHQRWFNFLDIYELVFSVMTFCILLASSGTTVALVRQQRLAVRGFKTQANPSTATSTNSTRSTTATQLLFGSVGLFFATQITVVVRNTLLILKQYDVIALDISPSSQEQGNMLIIIVARLNLSFDFFAYLVSSRTFRQQAKDLFMI